MKTNSLQISIVFILLLSITCKTKNSLYTNITAEKNPLYTLRNIEDSIFNSSQKINILSLNKKQLNKNYFIDIAYSDSDLIKTSKIAINNNAIAAINGSFFNMDKGGSVTYFEKNNKVINYTANSTKKWGKSDSIINGAIIITTGNKIKIQYTKAESFYKNSKKENCVLITGPLLIKNSKIQKLPDINFTRKRHPRTCLAITKDSILLITIDGRYESADGINLYELQIVLQKMKCIDAINLDGGGSTTLWTKKKGIINTPCDKTGERTVANAIIIKEK